jgi:hypothetical protein
LFLSNRAGLEEAFILAAEKDEAMSAEMAEALSGGGKLRADTGGAEARGGAEYEVDVSESLFLEDIESDDEEYLASENDDDSGEDDEDYEDENG